MKAFAILIAASVLSLQAQQPPQPQAEAPAAPAGPLTVQITSPLGRTGMTGPVRVVARVVAPKDATLSPVQFYIDGKLVGEDKDGPPYAIEWSDENPFEKRFSNLA